jgi:hypothetical protein
LGDGGSGSRESPSQKNKEGQSMSLTYWLQFKNNTELESIETDLSLLCQEIQSLDELCQNLEVPLLSSFIDTTDAAYTVGVFDESINQKDFETDEPVYTLDQMQWFLSDSALPTFRSLRVALLENKTVLPHLNSDDRIELLEELDLSIATLEQHFGKEFHLELLV